MAWTERYCRADAPGGGDGTTNTNSGANASWTLAEAVANEAAGMRINVVAGTYASTSTTRTLAAAGTTTAPIWWRGCKATAGDMDGEPTSTRLAGTDIPSWTFTTGHVVVSGGHHILSNIDIVGANTTASMLSITGAGCRCDRVRVENTNAASGSRAASSGGATGTIWSRCWFRATSSATSVFNAAATMTGLVDCVFAGGGHGVDLTSANSLILMGCAFIANGGDGVHYTSAPITAIVGHCSFYNPGSDGIEFAALPTANGTIVDCVFSGSAIYDINNSTGTNTNLIHRIGNVHYGAGTAAENGMGDSPALYDLTDSAASFNGPPSDLSLKTGSAARAVAGRFENVGYTSYADRGAVQHQDSPRIRGRIGLRR